MMSFNFNFTFSKDNILQVKKIKWKDLSEELAVKILSWFMFSSRNLKVSISSLVIPSLVNFVFSREHVSFVLKTVTIGK